MGRIPDSEFGGTHFLGTGTYYAKTPEQAEQLYNELPKASPAEWAAIQSAPGFEGDKGGPGDPTQKKARQVTIKLLFFVTLWTAIASLLAFLVVGVVEQTDRWWQERRSRG